ncbi:hypothetical protein AB4305_24980 [Nocardia sp. 2YAB30]|uniref:hypothetical protein n=1 Tax=Nocardia sp. 2YAB30 TaxID=3233022 RepID=UPI003F984CEC
MTIIYLIGSVKGTEIASRDRKASDCLIGYDLLVPGALACVRGNAVLAHGASSVAATCGHNALSAGL